VAGVAALALLLAASSCGAPSERPPQPEGLGLRAMELPYPMGKVDFTLNDTEGRPFAFRARTDGTLTLLYFGYTYCPDVCPVQMGTLAASLHALDPGLRRQIHVVFVTVDPKRDTPERIRTWLDAFDSSFVGLRGSVEEVTRILKFFGYPTPEYEGGGQGDSYRVSHPAVVYTFTPDNLGRVMFGGSTTRQMWVHDLTILATHEWPAATGSIEIVGAYAPAPPTGDQTALYFEIRNTGAEADTLLEVATDVAAQASLHIMETRDGMMHMEPIGALPVPGGETVTLEPGARHAMLEGLRRTLEPGDTFEVRLRFARGGVVTVPVRVVRYTDMGR